MSVQGIRDGSCVFLVTQHSQLERFQSTHREPAIERRRNRPGGILQKLNRFEDRWIFGESSTLDRVGMSGKIFRDAVNNNIRPQFERLLEKRSRERIVYHHERVARVSQLTDRRDI